MSTQFKAWFRGGSFKSYFPNLVALCTDLEIMSNRMLPSQVFFVNITLPLNQWTSFHFFSVKFSTWMDAALQVDRDCSSWKSKFWILFSSITTHRLLEYAELAFWHVFGCFCFKLNEEAIGSAYQTNSTSLFLRPLAFCSTAVYNPFKWSPFSPHNSRHAFADPKVWFRKGWLQY